MSAGRAHAASEAIGSGPESRRALGGHEPTPDGGESDTLEAAGSVEVRGRGPHLEISRFAAQAGSCATKFGSFDAAIRKANRLIAFADVGPRTDSLRCWFRENPTRPALLLLRSRDARAITRGGCPSSSSGSVSNP